MNTIKTVNKKVSFATSLTSFGREICLNYLIQLLAKPANSQILHRLETDQFTTGHAYWEREKDQFQLRIDTFENKSMNQTEAVSYFIE